METYFVYTDGNTWYDKACNVRRLKHYLHSSLEKSLMERVNQPVFERQIRMFLMTIIRVCKLK